MSFSSYRILKRVSTDIDRCELIKPATCTQMQSADVTNDDALGGQSDTPITAQPVEVVDETKFVL